MWGDVWDEDQAEEAHGEGSQLWKAPPLCWKELWSEVWREKTAERSPSQCSWSWKISLWYWQLYSNIHLVQWTVWTQKEAHTVWHAKQCIKLACSILESTFPLWWWHGLTIKLIVSLNMKTGNYTTYLSFWPRPRDPTHVLSWKFDYLCFQIIQVGTRLHHISGLCLLRQETDETEESCYAGAC